MLPPPLPATSQVALLSPPRLPLPLDRPVFLLPPQLRPLCFLLSLQFQKWRQLPVVTELEVTSQLCLASQLFCPQHNPFPAFIPRRNAQRGVCFPGWTLIATWAHSEVLCRGPSFQAHSGEWGKATQVSISLAGGLQPGSHLSPLSLSGALPLCVPFSYTQITHSDVLVCRLGVIC